VIPARWTIAAALFLTFVAAGPTSGAGSASRIVERTLLCRTSGQGYPDPVSSMDVSASPRVGKHAPAVLTSNGPSGADGLSAGFYTGPHYGQPIGTLWFSRTRCSATGPRLPFSAAGLRGGRAPRFGDQHQCDVPSTVLIRVRAVFARPVALKPDRQATYLSVAKGRILSASIAVSTAQRKPIVLGSVDDKTGNATIFTSPSRCFLK
jgi:hypothetical protein